MSQLRKLELYTKQIVPCESTAEEVSFGNTIGFRPRTQKLELRTKEILPCKSTIEEVFFL